LSKPYFPILSRPPCAAPLNMFRGPNELIAAEHVPRKVSVHAAPCEEAMFVFKGTK
jgi:hypothetical protein